MGSLDKRYEKVVFGGKVMLLGGDFRQILPVVLHGGKEEILAASIVNSYLWKHVKVKHLTRNMRLKNGLDEKKFEEYFLDIGDGKVPLITDELYNDLIRIEAPHLMNGDMKKLGTKFYSELNEISHGLEYIANRIILTPRNLDVRKMNEYIGKKLIGKERNYLSADSVEMENDEEINVYATVYLNTIELPGKYIFKKNILKA